VRTTTSSIQPPPSTSSDGRPATIEEIAAAFHPGGTAAVFVGVFEPGQTHVAAGGVDGDGIEVTPDRAWEAASVGKMVVATAVLQLVDEGLVELDEPVSTYLDSPVVEAILVRDLLGHRSGIANMNRHLSSCPSESTIVEAKSLAEQAAAPLSESAYANTNFILLGELVRLVTGQDIGEYARDHIFDPMEMTSTYWWEAQSGPAPYWRRPLDDPGDVSPFRCPELGRTVGTEGLTFVSSLADMDAFMRGLFAGDLISAGALDEMLDAGPEDPAGLGVWVEADVERGVTLYGHFGSRGDFGAVAFFDPVAQRSVVVFASEDADPEEIMWVAWEWAAARDG
jgi:D-alanyl-D-alanine carboxypeptidase